MNELYSKKMFVIDADTIDVFFKHFQPFVDAIQADPLKAEAIIAMIPFGVYFKDLEGRYRVVNQIFEEISGKTHADIIGKRDKQIFPVNLAISLQNLYSRMIESKEALAEYIQTIDPEARATNYFAIAAPVKNNSGEIIGSAGFLLHLADISKNQDYYDEIEQQYHIILENTNDAISIIEDGMIRFHNPKLEELLGYNDEELRSIPFINHVHADDREAVAERYRIRVEGKFVLSPKAYRFIRKDGSVLWGSTSSVRIKRKHHGNYSA
ncbi:MAG: PAS domain S-box protein [Desulfosalsimonadaceae bacterium]